MLKTIIHVTLFSTTIFLVSCNRNTDKKEITIDEQYPKPWKEPSNEELISIGRVLIKSNVTGCGEYYVRPSSQSNGDYLIGCTSDGTSWNYYMVWVYTEKVMGPYADNSIEKPR